VENSFQLGEWKLIIQYMFTLQLLPERTNERTGLTVEAFGLVCLCSSGRLFVFWGLFCVLEFGGFF
jgi:hypothetical protein